MYNNVCVFASSSTKLNSIFYNEASYLGKLLGESGYNIVYGGSRLGIMYACASAVKSAGGKLYGVMPHKFSELHFDNPEDCDEFYITDGMRERKAKMDELSNAVIVLPGGFGTLEEFSEMIVQKQLGYNNKPIIILNTLGFYNNLIKFFYDILSNQFANLEAKNLFYIANTPDEVVSYLNNYNYNNILYSSKF